MVKFPSVVKVGVVEKMDGIGSVITDGGGDGVVVVVVVVVVLPSVGVSLPGFGLVQPGIQASAGSLTNARTRMRAINAMIVDDFISLPQNTNCIGYLG